MSAKNEGESYDFPSFSEGLSLRRLHSFGNRAENVAFPFLFGGAFIEGHKGSFESWLMHQISLPFRRGFH